MEPTLAMAYKNRGIARSRTGDEAAAVEDYNRALAISPDFRDVLRWRAKSLVNLRRIDDARKDVERYRELGGVSDEQLLRATGLSSPPGG
jgi:Tfp pilus assembly protein PilF